MGIVLASGLWYLRSAKKCNLLFFFSIFNSALFQNYRPNLFHQSHKRLFWSLGCQSKIFLKFYLWIRKDTWKCQNVHLASTFLISREVYPQNLLAGSLSSSSRCTIFTYTIKTDNVVLSFVFVSSTSLAKNIKRLFSFSIFWLFKQQSVGNQQLDIFHQNLHWQFSRYQKLNCTNSQ